MQRLRQEHYRRYVTRLGKTIADCPIIKNATTRNVALGDLPGHIFQKLNHKLGQLNFIVEDLIKVCADIPGGEHELFEILNKYEPYALSTQAVIDGWKHIKKEMDEQDRLVHLIKNSGVTWSALKQIYDAVTPQDYGIYPGSVETLVQGLWEVSAGKEPLSDFIQELQAQVELSADIRSDLQTWYVETRKVNGIHPFTNRVVGSDETKENRIIVAIEPGKQDPLTCFVRFWSYDGTNLTKELEFNEKVNQLEIRISEVIDDLTLFHEPVKVIEFYLPKALLSVPVDTWQIRSGSMQQRFVERYQVVKGILERQEACDLRTRIDREGATLSYQEMKRLIMPSIRNPLLKELVRCNKEWESSWHYLNDKNARRFSEIALFVSHDEPISLAENKPFALLTFDPPELASNELCDPVGKLMLTGTPLIVWVRSIETSPEVTAYVRHILYDAHCEYSICGANDIVTLIHKVYRRSVDLDSDPHEISRKLNLIVDNPERRLPDVGRVLL